MHKVGHDLQHYVLLLNSRCTELMLIRTVHSEVHLDFQAVVAKHIHEKEMKKNALISYKYFFFIEFVLH